MLEGWYVIATPPPTAQSLHTRNHLETYRARVVNVASQRAVEGFAVRLPGKWKSWRGKSHIRARHRSQRWGDTDSEDIEVANN